MKNKKSRNKEQKLLQLQSVQNFSPILDIKEGVISTKDGKFVKLMEFSPINFKLRSIDEQGAVISQFAALLRTMPANFHIKVVSKKSEVSKVVEILQGHYAEEDNARCRKMQQEQIETIENTGRERGVSRRFYIAFEYEPPIGLKKSPSLRDIRYNLDTMARTIASGMENCGNECVSPTGKDSEDDWLMATLYSIFSRGQEEVESYEDHKFRTLARYAMATQEFGGRSDLNVPINDFICPALIDTKTSPNYIVVKGFDSAPDIYYSFLYIPGASYPLRALAGWTDFLINIGDGVDLDIYIRRENAENTARKLTYILRSKTISAEKGDDTSTDFDDLMSSIDSGYYIKQGIAAGEEFYYFACMLTVTAHSLEELNFRIEEIRKYIVQHDMQVRKCAFQMIDAFRMSLPLTSYNMGIFNKARRNALGSQLASIYPFSSYEMSDTDGILLGRQMNGSLVLLDNFDTAKYANANICIMGIPGAGKTYLLQCMALRFREKRIQTFIIAPDKGHEFRRACEAIGGQFITIAPGSAQNINIMEIRKKDEQATQLIDGGGQAANSALSAKVQQLLTFFALLIPDANYEEKQYIDEALMATYSKFGITLDNESLIDPDDPERYKEMPILGDLHEVLLKMAQEGKATRRLATILGKFVTGSASSFNQQTNVNLDNRYIVLDVSQMTEEMLPIGMFIALDYVWDKAREDRTKKKVIFMDEGWKLIGPSATKEAANFALEVFKVIRGYGGAGVFATQNLTDFFSGRDGGAFGQGIINTSKIKIVMKTESTESERVQEALDLTDNERAKIATMKRGTGLLVAGSNHVFIEIEASKTEHNLITTDRKDLERLAEKKARAAEAG